MMLTELGEPGSWGRVFTHPNLDKFHQPTVVGVDFPSLGISQAWNDIEAGALWVETYAAASARGARTTWQVTQLPDAASASVQCDGSDYPAWRVVEPGTIELDTDISEHRFRIATGYRGDAPARTAGERRGSLVVPRRTSYVPRHRAADPAAGSRQSGAGDAARLI
jgi:hypothetical protein